jgi:hypothetical protein
VSQLTHENLTADPGLLVPNIKTLAVFILRKPMLENLLLTNKMSSCGREGEESSINPEAYSSSHEINVSYDPPPPKPISRKHNICLGKYPPSATTL